ncbi:MAG: AMP-binding protein, partial [Methylocystis sp.]
MPRSWECMTNLGAGALARYRSQVKTRNELLLCRPASLDDERDLGFARFPGLVSGERMARQKARTARTKAGRVKRRAASKTTKPKSLRKSSAKTGRKKASAKVLPPAPKLLPRPTRALKPIPAPRRPLRRRAAAPQPRLAPGRIPAAKRIAASAYDTDLDRTPANFQPLTPLSFLARTASAHPDVVAIVHGKARVTYAEFYARSGRLASALANEGVGKNDTVAVLLANTPPMLEAHHGVAMTGGVLNALNTRLDAASIAFMLDHGEAKVFIVDREFATTAQAALTIATAKPFLVLYDDPEFPQTGALESAVDYEEFLAGGDSRFAWTMPRDEWDAISLNYTSGTTGNPKGVVCHHRGAALMGYANILACRMSERP